MQTPALPDKDLQYSTSSVHAAMRDTGSSGRRSKRFAAMFVTLGVVLLIQILQFQSVKQDLLSYITQESSQHLTDMNSAEPANSLAAGTSSSVLQSQTVLAPPTTSPITTAEPSYYSDNIPTSKSERVVWESSVKESRRKLNAHSQYCYVVENVCRKTQPKKWFYFNESEDNGFQTKNSIPYPKQPLLTYNTGGRTRIAMDTNSFELNPTWIKEQQCTLSPIKEHVVLNGKHIHMMGEFVQRIIMPLHHLLEDYTNHAKNQSRVTNEKEIQFYINFYQNEDQEILPSHHLYMNGLQYGQGLQSWNDVNDPIDKINSPPCQCYSRLVFCGYEKKEAQDTITASRNVSGLILAPSSSIPFNTAKHCAHYLTKSDNLINDDCQVWQDLRISLISTYYKNNPNLSQDIHVRSSFLLFGYFHAFLSLTNILHRLTKSI